MIKEFWQERRTEKKQRKQLKKEQRKLPKSKEERAYKVFGFFFVVFLIVMSFLVCCSTSGENVDYSWGTLIGLNNEMKQALSAPVDRKTIITDPINVIDWSEARDRLNESGLLDIVVEDNISLEILLSGEFELEKMLVFKENELGALLSKFVTAGSSDTLILYELKLYVEDDDLFLETVSRLDLSQVLNDSTLPGVYVKSTSIIEILGDELSCLSTRLKINNLAEDMNDSIIDIINSHSFVEISYYTNEQLVSYINLFAESINAQVKLAGEKIIFEKITI